MAASEIDKRMELTEHLSELRSRLMRCMLYLLAGSVIGYIYFKPIYSFLEKPLITEITRLNKVRNIAAMQGNQAHPAQKGVIDLLPAPIAVGEKITPQDFNRLIEAIKYLETKPASNMQVGQVFAGFTEPFLVQLKLAIVVGFILVTPLVIWEAAMFVTPALTPHEKRPLKFLMPLSILLLIFGMTVAYFTLFFAIGWFMSFLDSFPDTTVLQNPEQYVMFFFKMMAAFGITFQLPVVLMGGAYLNLITSKSLIKNWKWGLMLGPIGALIIPSNDIPSMVMIAIPLWVLYFGSILLVKMVEWSKARRKPA